MFFHIASGAVLGFLAGVVYRIVLDWNSNRPTTWNDVLTAGLCGMVAGAVGAATFGLGSTPAATVGATAVRGMTAGATAAGSAQVVSNHLGGIPFEEGVPEAMLFGAATGVPVGGVTATISAMAARTAVGKAAKNYEAGRPLTEGVAEAGMASLTTGMVRHSARGIAPARPEGRGAIERLAEVQR